MKASAFLSYVRSKPKRFAFVGLVGAALLVGMLVSTLAGDKLKYRNRGTFGSDGVCRAPLGLYCDDQPPRLPIAFKANACPGYAQALQRAKDWEPLLEAAAGTCGALKWVRWSSGVGGETFYFDLNDTLLSVETWADFYGACSGKSATLVYGSRPSCEHQTTLTIKERPGQALTPTQQ
jgi:hypothetical protein